MLQEHTYLRARPSGLGHVAKMPRDSSTLAYMLAILLWATQYWAFQNAADDFNSWISWSKNFSYSLEVTWVDTEPVSNPPLNHAKLDGEGAASGLPSSCQCRPAQVWPARLTAETYSNLMYMSGHISIRAWYHWSKFEMFFLENQDLETSAVECINIPFWHRKHDWISAWGCPHYCWHDH